MSDKQKPAFPTNTGLGQHQAEGMTLRDYFAAKAMQALLGYEESTLQNDAEVAYAMADAMLQARNN
jgi:hypothetical protein